ncbi:ATP-binding cassette domain-containing protein, partial [Candidatus Saccharibacteria bacterium]|nr:ATP-binding cassette domain-containing protein [Candidatus Saccharibacteria bacterium]
EETPDIGKISIGGIDLDYVKKLHIPGYRRRLGVVFQDFKLLPRRTVYENVAFALEIAGMSGKDIRKTVPKVLELVDLSDQAKKFPDQLSGGQQQRVSIARSVARQPKILIADEPTANLDKLTTDEIINLLKRINDFGTTILVTTHNENIVNNLQKRVITMMDGKIVDDQKNGGIYKLDAEKISPMRRVIQTPGHAYHMSPEQQAMMQRRFAVAKQNVQTVQSSQAAATPVETKASAPEQVMPEPPMDVHLDPLKQKAARKNAQVAKGAFAKRRSEAATEAAAKPEKAEKVISVAIPRKKRMDEKRSVI